MDPRHESKKQSLLNQLIELMNHYLRKQLTLFYTVNELNYAIEKLATLIYRYAEKEVDIEAMLAKKNMLSTDPVFFPLIDELDCASEAAQHFEAFLAKINEVFSQQADADPALLSFIKEVDGLIEAYSRDSSLRSE